MKKRTRFLVSILEQKVILVSKGGHYSLFFQTATFTYLFLLQASPPQTAILALERASVSHVIPFREVGNEIAAIIGEPRNAYPTESPLPEQLSRMGESSRAGE